MIPRIQRTQRIQKLPPQLANQIAAGEVIERPASVIKELLENSLDARSMQIEITVEQGGLSLIRVQDDGIGIHKEDLALAITQHATSKILSLKDLENISSLGFRGEALASIASVSRFSLSSWVKDQDSGWTIRLLGREGNLSLIPSPKLPGTIIEVRDLFYNTPARQKFLRSPKTEFIHLTEVFKGIALSAFPVSFILKDENKIIKRLPACLNQTAMLNRVGNLCSQQFIQQAFYVESENNGLKLTGWIGGESALRAQSDIQYFYINGRRVRDKLVMHAIRESYQSICPKGRYPAYVLFFEIDFDALDVNVHPTKHEVRFRDARSVYSFLTFSIEKSLMEMSQTFLPINLSQLDNHSTHLDTPPTHLEENLQFKEPPYKTYKINDKTSKSTSHSTAKPIFLLGNDFLFLDNPLGLALVDIKGIRRFIIEKEYKENILNNSIKQKNLLLPKTLKIDTTNANFMLNISELKNVGFELNQIGPNEIIIRKIPAFFKNFGEEAVFLIHQLFSEKDAKKRMDLLLEFLINQELDLEEALALYENFNQSIQSEQSEQYFSYIRHITLTEFRTIFFKKEIKKKNYHFVDSTGE